MIPTYNRVRYLETTLQKLLQQDLGPERMQIEVIDNSSNGDVKGLVSGLGAGRIQLHHVAERMTVTEAMNLCVERARGQWVHILHDDDYVQPGFYEKVTQAFVSHPEVGAVLCRNETVDEDDRRLDLSVLEQEAAGVLENFLDRIAAWQRIQFVAIVVRRDVYESIGAFDTRLQHAADWDMWKRIAARFAIWYIPEVLASYRSHANSDTSRLVRTGANVADVRQAIQLSAAYLPPTDSARLRRLARKYYARAALNCAVRLLKRGDTPAALAQLREGWKTYPSVWFQLRVLLSRARHGWTEL